jgi:hypothetical protein
MLALNHSSSNNKQTLLNILKAFASILAICTRHVILMTQVDNGQAR